MEQLFKKKEELFKPDPYKKEENKDLFLKNKSLEGGSLSLENQQKKGGDMILKNSKKKEKFYFLEKTYQSLYYSEQEKAGRKKIFLNFIFSFLLFIIFFIII